MFTSYLYGLRMLSLLFLFTLIMNVWSYALQDVIRLKKDLFQNRTYDAKVRPLQNQSDVIQVNFFFTITAVAEVRLTDGIADFTGFIQCTWTDELLKWNPSEHNGIVKLQLKRENIWTPKLIQSYNIHRKFPMSMTVIRYNGLMIWFPVGDFRGICDQDMRHYPFDRHKCSIDIASADNDPNELEFVSINPAATIFENLTTGGQWKLKTSKTEVIEEGNKEVGSRWQIFRISFVLSRRPEFILLHLSIPYSFVVSLNIFTYLTPISSGERISFSITLMLAMVFYTTKIGEVIPNNSLQLAYASIFTLLTNVYAASSVAVSVILSKVSKMTSEPIPPWLVKRIKNERLKDIPVTKIHRNNNDGREVDIKENESGRGIMRDGRKMHKRKPTERDSKGNEINVVKDNNVRAKQDNEIDTSVTWYHVAEYCDRRVFYCNLVLTFLTFLCVFCLLLFGQ